MVLKSQNGKMIEEITTLGRKITPLQSHRDLQHHDWIVMTDKEGAESTVFFNEKGEILK